MHTFLYIQVAVGSYEWLSVLSFFKGTLIFICTCVFVIMPTPCVCGGGCLQGPERVWDSLELEFQVAVSCQMDAGN